MLLGYFLYYNYAGHKKVLTLKIHNIDIIIEDKWKKL